MKALAWIIPVVSIAIFVVWWRVTDVPLEPSEPARHLAISREANSTRAIDRDPTASSSQLPAKDSPRSPAGIPIVEPADVSVMDRIGELERVVAAQADVIEKLTARLDAADEQRQRAAARAWGPEQAAGAPDTPSAGDHRTAWAPAQADGGVEWVEATFANPTDVAQLVVRQNSNPGAITKIVAVTDTGTEIPVWSGADPSRGQALADTPFPFPAGVTTARVRVYLDTSILQGWEEIDALQLVGRDGSRQWAKSVNASSTYAGGQPALNFRFNVEKFGGSQALIEANP